MNFGIFDFWSFGGPQSLGLGSAGSAAAGSNVLTLDPQPGPPPIAPRRKIRRSGTSLPLVDWISWVIATWIYPDLDPFVSHVHNCPNHNLENIQFGSTRIWSKAQAAQNIHPYAGFVVEYIHIGWVWVFGQVCGVGGGSLPGPLGPCRPHHTLDRTPTPTQ